MPSSFSHPEVTEVLTNLKSEFIKVKRSDLEHPISIQKPYPSPVDWRDQPIYFLMIDRFNNPSSDPKFEWNKAVEKSQGGTFEGVRQKLSYIKNLGAGAIWLSPVLKNAKFREDYHGYGIMDFLEVNPKFGSTPDCAEVEFMNLVNEAHAHGLYVILDIVINHAADVFAYAVNGDAWNDAPWHDQPYEQIYWRDNKGAPRKEWTELPKTVNKDEGIWPKEFQNNLWFRRQGKNPPDPNSTQGDFASLKEFKTDLYDYYGDKPVQNLLIKAYQYVVAKFDVDGFRIDTIKHVERECALFFSNAIRELAYSIGKKNFFIFGEAKSNDETLLASYTGRYTSEKQEMVGADAVLDFPLQSNLVQTVKGFAPPTATAEVFNRRKQVYSERSVMSTHGEASRFFVTFLDNHDDFNRFLYPYDGGEYSKQLSLAVGCLYCLQGIPCLYYGTEQGLKGTEELYDPNYKQGGKVEHVREALWGKKPIAFDQENNVYKQIQAIARLRNKEPALRYGRQYFREVSGNNVDFSISKERGGILAFSRVLNDREVLVVANTSTVSHFPGWVLVDNRINQETAIFNIVYSNYGKQGSQSIVSKEATFYGNNGSISQGWARRLQVNLAPMEIQIRTNR